MYIFFHDIDISFLNIMIIVNIMTIATLLMLTYKMGNMVNTINGKHQHVIICLCEHVSIQLKYSPRDASMAPGSY